MKMQIRKRAIVYGVILALTLAFIWGNSMLSGEVSGAISHFIAGLFGNDQGGSDDRHFLIRKAAHFLEFAFLGMIFQLFSREMTNDWVRHALVSALAGVSVPLVDETIQIFSNRGYALPDVWIDISGYALGCAVTIFAFLMLRLAGKRRKRE